MIDYLLPYFETVPRIYHPWNLWEDYNAGFYDNVSGQAKEEKILLAVEMFESAEETVRCMNHVIENWKYSCEQNLTNEAMNKIAYIVQGACCIYGGVPSTATMEAWSRLDKETQEQANRIAFTVAVRWVKEIWSNQTCLNLG